VAIAGPFLRCSGIIFGAVIVGGVVVAAGGVGVVVFFTDPVFLLRLPLFLLQLLLFCFCCGRCCFVFAVVPFLALQWHYFWSLTLSFLFLLRWLLQGLFWRCSGIIFGGVIVAAGGVVVGGVVVAAGGVVVRAGVVAAGVVVVVLAGVCVVGAGVLVGAAGGAVDAAVIVALKYSTQMCHSSCNSHVIIVPHYMIKQLFQMKYFIRYLVKQT